MEEVKLTPKQWIPFIEAFPVSTSRDMTDKADSRRHVIVNDVKFVLDEPFECPVTEEQKQRAIANAKKLGAKYADIAYIDEYGGFEYLRVDVPYDEPKEEPAKYSKDWYAQITGDQCRLESLENHVKALQDQLTVFEQFTCTLSAELCMEPYGSVSLKEQVKDLQHVVNELADSASDHDKSLFESRKQVKAVQLRADRYRDIFAENYVEQGNEIAELQRQVKRLIDEVAVLLKL